MLVSTLVQALILLVGLPLLIYISASLCTTGGLALALRCVDRTTLDRQTRRHLKRNLKKATAEIVNYEFSKFLSWYILPLVLLVLPRSADSLPDLVKELGPVDLHGESEYLYPKTRILGISFSKRSYIARLVRCVQHRGEGALEMAREVTGRILPLDSIDTQNPFSSIDVYVSKGSFELIYKRDVNLFRYIPFLTSIAIGDEYHYGYRLMYDTSKKLNFSYPVAKSSFIAFKWIPRK